MQVEQPPGGLPPLTPVEVENLAEILDKVRYRPNFSPVLNHTTIRLCPQPRRVLT